MLPILYYQYYCCWCPGDLRSQCISRHGIDQISQNIPSLALEELILRERGSGWLIILKPEKIWFALVEDFFNTLSPRQNGHHFADDIFKRIFLNENIWIPIKISLKFVPKVSINNIPALVQIMAWRCPGDKPLSEPLMVNLPTHICVTRPQWVNTNYPERKIYTMYFD